MPQVVLFLIGISLIICPLIYFYYNTATFLNHSRTFVPLIAMGIFCIILSSRLYDLVTANLLKGEATFVKSKPSRETSEEE